MTFYVPSDKEARIDEFVKSLGISRSAWIMGLIDKELQAHQDLPKKSFRFNMRDGSRRIIAATTPAQAVQILGNPAWTSWREVEENPIVDRQEPIVSRPVKDELTFL